MSNKYNFINIKSEAGMISVYDADTQELLFVMGSENMLNRATKVDADHRRNVVKAYDSGWSEHRVEAAKNARMLLFVGIAMPEKLAKNQARELDKFSKSKQ